MTEDQRAYLESMRPNDKIIGFDKLNPLSSTLGKVKIIKQLKLKGTVHVIGDGYTDYEIKKEGYADYFYLFVENIKRDSLLKNAEVSNKKNNSNKKLSLKKVIFWGYCEYELLIKEALKI